MASEKELNIRINTEADTSSVTELQTLLEEVKTQMENLSTNVDTSGVEEIGSSASNVASEVSEATSSVEEFKNQSESVSGSGFDDVAESVEGINKSMEDVKQNQLDIGSGAMLNFVSGSLQQASQSAEQMAVGMNEASISVGQLATQTHMSEDAMVGLVNEISNVTFPNDEAMMYIKNLNQMGVKSQNFAQSATNIDKINDAFGMGARTTNSLATELSVLGVDMNDVSSSFNALAYANANTKGGMENFYLFLRKYDSQLHELGYNVDQSAIIIAGATQKFGGGRAALSGLSDALKEADGDSRKLEQALGLQAGSLDNASQITSKYEGELQKLADEEMEHKTLGQRLGAVWEDISLSMGNALSPIMSVVGALGQFGSMGMQWKGLKILMEDLGKLKKLGVSGVVGKMKDEFNSLKGSISSVKNSITSFGSTIKDKLSNISIFKDEKGSLGGGQAKTFDSLRQKISTTMDIIKTKISTGFSTAKEKISSSVDIIKSKVSTGFSTAKQKIVDFASTAKSNLISGFNTIKSSLSTAFSNIKSSVISFANTTKTNLINIKSKVVELSSSIKTTLIGAFNNAKARAVTFASTLKTTLIGAFNTVKSGIITLASSIKTTLVSAFSAGIAKAKELALGLIDLGKKALISGYNALKSAGMWLVEKASLLANAVAKGVATVSSWALAVAEWAVASPIIIIIGVIVILVGLLIYLYTTNETVRNSINNLGQTFVLIGQMIWDAMVNAYNTVVNYLMQLWQYITSIGQMILQSVGISSDNITASILGFIVFMATLPLQIGIIFTNIIAKVLGFGDNFVQRMITSASKSVSGFASKIGGMYTALKNELSRMLDAVKNWASDLWNRFKQAAIDAVNAFLSGLGINSPGIMQRTLVWEITEMGNRVPKESKQVLSNIGKLGTNIVDEFGNPTLETDYAVNGEFLSQTKDNNNGEKQIFNINIEVGSVDNEERTDEIVNAIIRRLKFENSTAGRTV